MAQRGAGTAWRTKKLLILLNLLDECPDELEADFQRVYGIDIRQMGRIGVAHCAVLASQLLVPGTLVAGHYDVTAGWSRTEVLLGQLLDEFRTFEWGLGGGKGKQPESCIPRSHRQLRPGESRHYGTAVPIDVIDELFPR